MANRYWIGGIGNWSDTSHWSDTSGGSGGFSVPSLTDDVYLDANSGTGTVTTDVTTFCRSFNCTGYTGTFVNSAGYYMYVYGDFILNASMTFTSYYIINFAAASGSWTINSAGKTCSRFIFGINTSTATWTLASNLTVDNGLYFQTGNFDTAGYDIVNYGALYANTTSATSVYLRDSIITQYNTFISFDNPNLILNAGTSTLDIQVYPSTITFGNNAWYNVNISGPNNVSGCDIFGSASFNNLTLGLTGGINSVQSEYSFNSNITISGTLTANGAVSQRISIIGDSFSPITLSVNTLSASYVDFYNITAAGAATWSGISIGNIGNNTGITFESPKTVYFNYPSGGEFRSYSTPKYALTSGGTVSLANNPLPQDTIVIDNVGLNSGATLGDGNTYNMCLPTMDFSTRTNPFNFNTGYMNVCRNLSIPSMATLVGDNLTYFTNCSFTANGKTVSGTLYFKIGLCEIVDAVSGANLASSTNTSLVINGAVTLSGIFSFNGSVTANAEITSNSSTSYVYGNLNLNSNITAKNLYFSSTPTINFNTYKFIVTGDNATVFSCANNIVTTGTPVIDFTYAGSSGTRTIAPNTTIETNTISFNITAGSDIISIGNGYIRSLNFTGFSGTLLNTSISVYGDLTFSSGMTLTGGANSTTFAATSGTKTITTNGKTLDFPIIFNGVAGTWKITDSLTQGFTRGTTLRNGTLDLNGQTYTCGYFVTASGTKNLTFNGGTLVVPSSGSSFSNSSPANFTTTAGTGTGKIVMSGTTNNNFIGGSSTYNCTLENASSSSLIISGNNTFTTISNSVQPTTFTFTSGTTQTVTNFNVSGTSGSLVTINASSTTNATLSKSSGIVNVNYCNISKSTALGGANWQAYTINGNVNGGSNSGWKFAEFNANGLFFGSNF